MSDNRTIAKNTLFLYARMIVTMLITLYTSRVILEKLGIEDYGIYQAVGGIVGFLSFLNGAISTGTSRFLTFELGRGDFPKLKKTFSTLLSAHFILAGIVVLIAETVGLWFVYNKMVIAPDRLDAALWVYHISILTAIFTLTQVPYNSSIIAHERMGIYAYLSIFDATAKLSVCYLIGIGNADRLVLYAILIFIVQASLMLMYRMYCVHNFIETKYQPSLDKSTLKPILSFSSWSLFAHGAIAFSNQGILVLLNLFFSPSVVSARAISLQVNAAANQLVSNFQAATNPQIVKLCAIDDFQGSKKLLLQMTKFSFYLMLLLGLPIIFLAEPLLKFWLGGNVPPYTIIFLQIVVIQSLFQVFDTSLYTALYAKAHLKENALISPFIVFLTFPIVYMLLKAGYSPVVLSLAYLCCYVILALIVKPLLVIKIANYTWEDIISVFRPCLLVSLSAIVPAMIIDKTIDSFSVSGFLIEAILLALVVCVMVYIFGLDKQMRNRFYKVIIDKIKL